MAWWSKNTRRSTGDRAHQEALLPLAELNAAGTARLKADRPELAVDLFVEALAGCREQLGAAHADTLTVAGNLGVALVQAGRWQEGIDVLEGNHAARIRALGDDDPRTLTAGDALATAYRLAGRAEEIGRASCRERV